MNKLINDDCLNAMKNIEDNSIGIELSTKQCEFTKNRLENNVNNLFDLFDIEF